MFLVSASDDGTNAAQWFVICMLLNFIYLTQPFLCVIHL